MFQDKISFQYERYWKFGPTSYGINLFALAILILGWLVWATRETNALDGE